MVHMYRNVDAQRLSGKSYISEMLCTCKDRAKSDKMGENEYFYSEMTLLTHVSAYE
jgi:hypothetical protein